MELSRVYQLAGQISLNGLYNSSNNGTYLYLWVFFQTLIYDLMYRKKCHQVFIFVIVRPCTAQALIRPHFILTFPNAELTYRVIGRLNHSKKE